MTNHLPSNNTDRASLIRELKQLIADECETEIDAEDILDDEYLLGDVSRLALDSLDALQISLAVQKRYGKRVQGGNESRLALTSVETLAQFIQSP